MRPALDFESWAAPPVQQARHYNMVRQNKILPYHIIVKNLKHRPIGDLVLLI